MHSPAFSNRTSIGAHAMSATRADGRGCVPPNGVGAVGKWPAGATAESLARAGHLPTAAASEVVNVAAPGRVGLGDATPTRGPRR